MYVRIGQIAQALNVSTHLLKHYESMGLIFPIKDEDSKYRYYDENQCERIIECKMYRNMGLTLKEIALVFEGEGASSNQVAIERMEALEEELIQLQKMKHMAMVYYERCCEFDQKYQQWFVELSPKRYFHPIYEGDQMINYHGKEGEELMELAPLSQRMVYFSEEGQVQWGVCIETKDMKITSFEYVEIPSQRMLTLYLKIVACNQWEEELVKQIQSLFPWFTKQDLKGVYCICMKKEYTKEEEYSCYKIFLPSKHVCRALL